MTNTYRPAGTPSPAERELIAGTIGADLADYRARHSLTMAALGRRTGVNSGIISSLEKGRTRPSFDVLARLAGSLAPAGWAEALVAHWVVQLGASVAKVPGLAVSVAREDLTQVFTLAAQKLGLDVDEHRVRLAVMSAIEELQRARDGERDTDVVDALAAAPLSIEAGPAHANQGSEGLPW